jgi:hypothetical protein
MGGASGKQKAIPLVMGLPVLSAGYQTIEYIVRGSVEGERRTGKRWRVSAGVDFGGLNVYNTKINAYYSAMEDV